MRLIAASMFAALRLISFCCSVEVAHAQRPGTIIGQSYTGTYPNGAENLVNINPVSGGLTTLGGVPDSGSLRVFQGVAAVDSTNRRYLFLGLLPPAPNEVLFEMNLDTGAELAAVPLSLNLTAMAFDSSSGYLFSHTYVGTYPNGAETLVSIDPASANVSTVGSVPNSGSLGVVEGVAALDSIHRRYFFLGVLPPATHEILYEMNLDTGAELAAIPLSVNLTAMEFDSLSGYLFGHTYAGSYPNGAETLVSIDPASGNVSTVGSLPNSGSLNVVDSVAALDSVHRGYFFVGLLPPYSHEILYEMNLDTGAELAASPLSVNLSAIELAAHQPQTFSTW